MYVESRLKPIQNNWLKPFQSGACCSWSSKRLQNQHYISKQHNITVHISIRNSRKFSLLTVTIYTFQTNVDTASCMGTPLRKTWSTNHIYCSNHHLRSINRWLCFISEYQSLYNIANITSSGFKCGTGCWRRVILLKFNYMESLKHRLFGWFILFLVKQRTITDIFSASERGNAMGFFFLGPLIGPVLGPLAGGYINQCKHHCVLWYIYKLAWIKTSKVLGWRMIFWILTAMGGAVLILIVMFLPETSRKHIKKSKEQQANQATNSAGSVKSEATLITSDKGVEKAKGAHVESFHVGLIRPLKFLMKPVVILSSLPYAFAFGFMYFMIATLPHQLEYKYGFNTGQIGLAYLANGIGNAMGAVFGGQYSDWLVSRLIKKSPDGRKTPEMRIGAMWVGVILIPIGDLVYGWCIQAHTTVWLVLFGFFISKSTSRYMLS